MWMNKPANGPDRDEWSGPIGQVVREWTVRPNFSRSDLPFPCNDPGFPPKSSAGNCMVLLVCTGTEGSDLSLDVVLRTARGDQTLLCGVSERDAIAEARRIGALYGAPLAMLSLTGHLVQLEPASPASPRRLGSPLSGRRPRFLARRKVGIVAVPAAESASERKLDGNSERAQKGASGKPGGQNEAGIAIRAK